MIFRLSSRFLAGALPRHRACYSRSAPAFQVLDRKLLLATTLSTQPKTRNYATKNAPKLKPSNSDPDEDDNDAPRQTFGGGGQGYGPGGMNLRDAALTTVVGLGLGKSYCYNRLSFLSIRAVAVIIPSKMYRAKAFVLH